MEPVTSPNPRYLSKSISGVSRVDVPFLLFANSNTEAKGEILVALDGASVTNFTVEADWINGVGYNGVVVLAAPSSGILEVIGNRSPRRSAVFNKNHPFGPEQLEVLNREFNILQAQASELNRDLENLGEVALLGLNIENFRIAEDEDWTSAFERAAATGKMIYVPTAEYEISDDVTGLGSFFFAEDATVSGGIIYCDCLTARDTEEVVVNGSFVYWPEGTLFENPSSGTYVAGVFLVLYDGSAGSFDVSLNGGPLSVGAANGMRWSQASQVGDSTFRRFEARLEDASIFNADKATLSWGFTNPGASPISVRVRLRQFFGTQFDVGDDVPSSEITCLDETVIVQPGNQRFQFTMNMPTTAGKTFGSNFDDFIRISFDLPVVGAFDVAMWQLRFQRGTVRTPFQVKIYDEIIGSVDRFLEIKRVVIAGPSDAADRYMYTTIDHRQNKRGRVPPVISFEDVAETKVNVSVGPARHDNDMNTTIVYIRTTGVGNTFVETYVKIDARL